MSGIIAPGGGGREKNGFGSHARWQPVTQIAGSRQSYATIVRGL